MARTIGMDKYDMVWRLGTNTDVITDNKFGNEMPLIIRARQKQENESSDCDNIKVKLCTFIIHCAFRNMCFCTFL